MIGPGLRLGYVWVPAETRQIKDGQVSDQASGFASMIVADYLEEHLEQHLQRPVH